MAASSLPPASSGLFLETSFRRSLASCQEIMAGDCKGREDLKAWRSSPLFHHYVETLQEQLQELGATAGGRIDGELLEQYRQHVAAIASQLGKPDFAAASTRPTPLTSPPPVLQNGNVRSPLLPLRVPALPPAAVNSSRNGGGSSTTAPAKDSATDGPAAAQPMQPPAAASAAARPPPQQGRVSTAPSSQVAQERLQTQANLQESLTEELAGMAASLKTSTLAVEGKLRERGQLLGSAETALDHSLHHTRQSAAEAKRIHSKGRVNFCMTCLVMMIVGLTFAGMFMFIKLTRFAGYKATRVPAAAAAPPAHGEL